MPRHRAPYPPEFRAEAVRLVREGGRTPRQLAQDLGCPDETIRNRLKQADRDEGRRSDGLTTAEREELRRLPAENRVLARNGRSCEQQPPASPRRRPGEPVSVHRGGEGTAFGRPTVPVLQVARSGFYAWLGRQPSARARADGALAKQIRVIHHESRGTYGAPRVHADLAEAHSIHCGRKRVVRLMRAAGLTSVCRRRTVRTTRRNGSTEVSADLVQRAFVASAPNRLWVAVITYLPMWQGFLYLAVVLDVVSRRVVGWAMADHLRMELMLDALEMALWNRRPSPGLVHHSDHGCQYTSLTFGSRCRQAGSTVSMGSVGDCYDNALAESLFATLECELIAYSHGRTHAEARMAVFDYIEGFYTPAGVTPRLPISARSNTKGGSRLSRLSSNRHLSVEVRQLQDGSPRWWRTRSGWGSLGWRVLPPPTPAGPPRHRRWPPANTSLTTPAPLP